jgi:dynein heavy chain 1
MGRIFVGLCQVGAWGCFDEFNRLEERMLSAVSQQILQIQTGLREQVKRIDLMGKDIKLNP